MLPLDVGLRTPPTSPAEEAAIAGRRLAPGVAYLETVNDDQTLTDEIRVSANENILQESIIAIWTGSIRVGEHLSYGDRASSLCP